MIPALVSTTGELRQTMKLFDKEFGLAGPSFWGAKTVLRRFFDAGREEREKEIVAILHAYKARWEGHLRKLDPIKPEEFTARREETFIILKNGVDKVLEEVLIRGKG